MVGNFRHRLVRSICYIYMNYYYMMSYVILDYYDVVYCDVVFHIFPILKYMSKPKSSSR